MIDADVVRLKRQDFDSRILAVEAARYSDPVECSFTFAELRDQQIRKNIRRWVKGMAGKLPGENSVYELIADSPATTQALRNAFRPARSLQLTKKRLIATSPPRATMHLFRMAAGHSMSEDRGPQSWAPDCASTSTKCPTEPMH